MNKSTKIIFSLSALTIIVFAIAMVKSFINLKSSRETRVKAANVIVYTHSSFMDAYGSGAELKAEFEKSCDCTIEYVDVGGAASAIERIKLDPERRVDVILGLDHLLLGRAAQHIKVQEIVPPDINWVKAIRPYVYSRFMPYDWSPMGFIYRKSETQPAKNWKEAFQSLPKNSMSVQDPSMSAPGLEFLYWLYATQEDFAAALKKVSPIIHTYSPSWSASYGLF
ncbi:MAG: hypothetical protein KDD38_07820, partial [Bdellovibrionales bacterium]|nr:hypothetical protein [Bdellovibrionales bacterium]